MASFSISMRGGVVLLMLTLCLPDVMGETPSIYNNGGADVVGRNRTWSCSVSSSQNVVNPLSWSLDGVPVAAKNTQKFNSTPTVWSYNSYFEMTILESSNRKVIVCTATFSGQQAQANWTIYAYKSPNTPVISGPSAVQSGVSNSWTCVVDGASAESPSVHWEFSNRTKISPQNFYNTPTVYTDSNQFTIHKETSNLTLTVTAGAPSFNLQCVAIHSSTATEVKSSVAITVSYPPQIAGAGTNYTFTDGTTGTLSCQITSSPSLLNVTWYKDGVAVDMTSGRYSGSTAQSPGLIINSITRADTGGYVCSATNSIGTTNGAVNYMIVRYLPIISYSQNPVSQIEGADLTLSCNIDAYPAHTTVFWYRVDSVTQAETPLIPGNNPAKYSGGTAAVPALTIKSLASSDAGLYKCKADNNVGRGNGSNLEVQLNSTPYQPVITSQPTLTGTEPNDVTVTCTVDALPTLTSLAWYKDGQLLDTSDATHYSGGNTGTTDLTILTVEASDAGSYYCVATNSMGTTTGGTTNVTINYFPVFTIPNADITENGGSSVTLTVSIAANPPVTSLQWRRYATSQSVSFTTINVGTPPGKYNGGSVGSPSLVINDLTNGDSGVYELVANSNLGSRTSPQIALTVSTAPSTPTVTAPDSSYTEGDLITLSCSASSSPAPSFRWYRGTTIVSTSQVLTISSATPEDNTQFRCEAYNSKGSSDTFVDINVRYKPRSGSTLSNVTANIDQTVTLTCATDANPSPSSYSWTRNGQSVSSASSSSQLTVLVANSSMFGAYNCRATNVVGTSDNIPVFILQDTSGGDGNVGASTEASGLSTATLVLIIIVCLIILIVILLIIIYLCTTRKCCRKENDVGPSQVPVVVPYPTKASEPKLNGFHSKAIPPITPRDNRISMDEEKLFPMPPPPAANGFPPQDTGVTISLPGGSTPRPHHLPPLGLDGVGQEKESARDDGHTEKKKKRRRRRRHDGEDESPRHHHYSPQHDPDV